MIPISDDNPTLRFPVVTVALLVVIGAVWLLVQGAGFDPVALAASTCNWGMVPGELTGRARVGLSVPLGQGLACVVDNDPRNILTPLTSMFLHGGWSHILGNGLFLWVFGNNVEDSMGRFRFVIFYLVCGLAAAAAQVFVSPASPVPMVGASGAISGVLGAYLLLYPRVRVNLLVFLFIFIRVIPVPAWMMLLWWIGLQVLSGLPQLSSMRPEVSSGVAVWAHIGGFAAGLALIKLFVNPRLMEERRDLFRPAERRRPW
ncbi:MAG TPA: rhomboid family intramembrane serine protease [Polyangia bacterium]|nr:rhomboid family intramembrane serine protease [Polyangia bacterium]